MAYIGAQPNKTLTETTSQSFNGTGSATAFTLNRAVNTGEELEVFVDNVQQEPGSGKSYTATGTTLTFDEAPPSGTGNVYVIYRGQAEVTTRLEHDPNQALSATTGTFTGNVDINGNNLILDADADSNLSASVDDTVVLTTNSNAGLQQDANGIVTPKKNLAVSAYIVPNATISRDANYDGAWNVWWLAFGSGANYTSSNKIAIQYSRTGTEAYSTTGGYLIAPRAGCYRFTAQISIYHYANNATSYAAVGYSQDSGSNWYYMAPYQLFYDSSGSNYQNGSLNGIYNVGSTTWFTVQFYLDTPGTAPFIPGNGYLSFTLEELGNS